MQIFDEIINNEINLNFKKSTQINLLSHLCLNFVLSLKFPIFPREI